MARPRKPDPTPTTSSLVASAVSLPVVTRNRVGTGQGWQAEAWKYYDTVGELRFVANWVGNVMSRAELFPAELRQGEDKRLNSGPAADALHAYFDGEAGQAEMLRATGIHLTVAGECYHVYRAKQKRWQVLAYDKVTQQGSGTQATIRADFSDGDGKVIVGKGQDLVLRVWNPHPLDPWQADSPVRSSLASLAEIHRTTQAVRAILASRLAGNGLLMMPSDITFPTPANAPEGANQADIFMATLGEAMLTPIEDPDDASAVVPIVITAPGENIKDARHMTFSAELPEQIRLMRQDAVKRFALGMDVPPEVLIGMENANHWNAWLIDEASVKAHTEPRLAVVTNAITTGYMRPAVDGDYPDTTMVGVVADTASIRLRPNRSKEAIELWDRGELSADALRRETGFGKEDEPKRNEMKEWLLRKIALGSTSPEQTQAAAEALGIDLLADIQIIQSQTGKERPDSIDNRRTIESDRRAEGPDLPEAVAASVEVPESLLAACDVLVFRALERAGNRLKSRHNYTGRTAAADLYLEFDGQPDVLLADALTCMDRVLPDAPPGTEQAIDHYLRYLITSKTPHSRTRLAMALTAFQVAV